MPVINAASFSHNKIMPEECARILQFVAWHIESIRVWNRDSIEQSLTQLAEALGVKIRDLLFPVFIAIAGTAVSISVIDSMAILGLDLSRARMRHGLATLGGISNKQMKNLEKEYQQVIRSDKAAE